MLTPDQFEVNEAWIAIRVNEKFIFVEDNPYDIFVLLDGASTYVFGFVLSSVVDESPNEKDVGDLFKEAWETKQEWARKLIVADDSIANDVFIKEAKKHGLEIDTVPAFSLAPIVGELKEIFCRDFMGKTG
jgi:hypothetical protein